MVGLATRIVIAQRTAAELKLSGAPESAIIEANERWYYFGALGPAIGVWRLCSFFVARAGRDNTPNETGEGAFEADINVLHTQCSGILA
ncbi:hypothetical protein [Caballeronia sp. DA-9]|uniref:hypothetical protein n=1 Tax=Caballeronia sp. DA-9 TaxID=3436237 RepID=UPI003F670771